jgi:hypothetical protein
METYGRSSVSEFLGDFLVYRNLIPCDPRLPTLQEIRNQQLGLETSMIPRKSTPEYARVMVHLLNAAKELNSPKSSIERILYVGDTRLNDGNAFLNICQVGSWAGIALIAAEDSKPKYLEIEDLGKGLIVSTNRWSALSDFDRLCAQNDIRIDERTAVLIDLDKTALGARGRNDQVIDRARVQAASQTVSEQLGNDFNLKRFFNSYSQLNQPEFHPLTADNQDYLVYICLILASKLYELDSLIADVRSRRLTKFDQFIDQVGELSDQMPESLVEIHLDMYTRVQQGDPTPFKTFRINEYLATAELMGNMDESAAVEALLDQEIVITQEVRAAAISWREQGALLFGLSDKPDEASIPGKTLASQGFKPIHQMTTDVVGE